MIAFLIPSFVISDVLVIPTLFLSFSIKPVIYGSLATKLLRIPSIVMITGLGTAFITNNWLTKIVRYLYRIALSSVSIVFFQNTDDKNIFINNQLVSKKVCRMTPGSGVDLEKFSFLRMPTSQNIVFLLIARMLLDKGVSEFVKAATAVNSKMPNTQFQLLGPLGVQNRTAITISQMNKWEKNDVIEYLGETDNVLRYIEKATCIVLPSYREGTSRVLLEAAAMGRPIITTDVPGCREIVEHGKNGFLCKPKDKLDLEKKMIDMLLMSRSDRQAMGEKGRQKVENEFNQDIVIDLYLDAIDNVIS